MSNKSVQVSFQAVNALRKWSESVQPGDVLPEQVLNKLKPALLVLSGLVNDMMHADYAFSVNKPDSAKHYVSCARNRFISEHPFK